MILIKSLIAANKSERVKFRIPRSVQQSIPIRCVYPDGIWQVGNKHSKSWRFADVNYAAASEEDRRSIFLSYGSSTRCLRMLRQKSRSSTAGSIPPILKARC